MAIISLRYSTTANSRPDPSALVAGEVAINTSTTGSGVFYASDTGALLKVGAAEVSATAPNSTPAGVAGNSLGELWLDTTTDTLNVWDGSSWLPASTGTVTSVAAGTGLSGGTITTSGTITLNTACVIAPTAFTGKGVLLTASATSSPTALTVGTNGQFLSVNSACTGGLEWSTITQCTGTVTSVTAGSGLTGGTITGSGTIALDTACAINPSVLAAKGSLVTASAASTPVALAVGTDGEFLTACAACAGGLAWTAGGGGGGSPATPTVAGIVFGCTTTTNSAIGCNAFLSNVSGQYNTASGACSLICNTSGGYNTASGVVSLYYNISGCYNTATGFAAMQQNETGDGNTATGQRSLFANTSGALNTAVGSRSLFNNLTGVNNTAIGTSAGSEITSGAYNLAIGNCVQVSTPTGSCQLAIGFSATENWLTGDSTKAIKPGAGILDCADSTGTAGQVLMSDGANAVCWGTAGGGGGSTPATPTVAGVLYGKDNEDLLSSYLGFESGNSVTTGVLNVLLGFCAGHDLTEGSGNTAVGPAALLSATTASCNTAIGLAASSLTTGVCNVAIGHQSGASLVTSAGNVLVGFASGLVADGDNNTAIGTCALDSVSPVTGSNNVAIGYSVSLPSATDSCQLAIGFNTGCNWLTGCSNKNIRPGAGILDCTGSPGTAGQVLMSDGANAVCWGTAGGGGGGSGTVTSITAGTGLTGGTITTSGTVALDTACVIAPSILTSAGSIITASAPSTPAELAVGADGQVLTACAACTGGLVWGTAGGGGGGTPATPDVAGIVYGITETGAPLKCNTAIGFNAASCITSGGGIGNVAVGTCALTLSAFAVENTAVGTKALYNNVTGSSNTAIGFSANISGTTSQQNVAVGAYALCATSTGCANVAIGAFAGKVITTGNCNVAIGYCAMGQSVVTSEFNVAIGYNAGLRITSGLENTMLGAFSGRATTTGAGNTFIGNCAGVTTTTGTRNVVIGMCATTSTNVINNEVTISNGCRNARFAGATPTAWAFSSDGRDKTNIQDLALGLDFVTALQPRKYEWNSRDNQGDHGVPSSGFIAQEVLEVVKANNAEYSNLVQTCNPDHYMLSQANFIPFLVNAIKELSVKVESLEQKLTALG